MGYKRKELTAGFEMDDGGVLEDDGINRVLVFAFVQPD